MNVEDNNGPAEPNPACGPGCDCNAPARGGRHKMPISLAVMAAVVGILAYKWFAARQANAGYAAASFEMAASFGAASDKSLDSFGDLNRFAMDQDAVFVFVPNRKGENISDKSKEAVLSAHKILAGKGTKVGLFTLKKSSPDYKGVSAQIPVPAVLVIGKGRGMAVVSGEATEDRVLQAFVESSRAGSCGPASCAPGACQ